MGYGRTLCHATDGAVLMNGPIPRIERLLTRRNARLALLLIALVTAYFTYSLKDVRLDHEFERFFPTDDPELDRYAAFRKKFGNDNDLLLIGAENQPSIFDPGFIQKVDSLAAALQRLEDVKDVRVPTRLEEMRVTPFGVFGVPWLRYDDRETVIADSARIWRDGQLLGSFIARSGDAIMILLQTKPNLSKKRSDALLEQVDALVENSGLDKVRLAGRIHGQYWYIEKMKRELVIFMSISILLLALFLAVANRTIWGVLVPIAVVGLTVLWQVAFITLAGKPLTILTMLLPTILFVVGMSDVVHITERFMEALRNGHPKQRALAIAYHEVGLATFLTSLTTAIGFATLMTSSIIPIREFGLFTALGVFLAFVLAFTLLPAVLLLVPTPVRAADLQRLGRWQKGLGSLYLFVLRNRRWIPIAFLLLTIGGAAGISRLKVDNTLLEDWSDDDPQKQAYFWFEEHFGGARPFEMQVDVIHENSDIWDLDVLKDIEKVQDRLIKENGIAAIVSPVTIVKGANKAMNGGDVSFLRLPEDQRDLDQLMARVRSAGAADLSALVTDDGRSARISGRMKDEGGYIHRQRDKALQEFIAANTDTSLVNFKQTGMAYLIDRNNERLSSQMIGGLSIAFLLIAFIMAWVFKNWRMTLIALVPNVIPLVIVGGVMALTGIDIKVSTAIIFTIAFGIAVDDTIHLLGKLRIELMKGKSLPYAMKRSFISAGKAVIITSIMLFSGFMALVFSSFASVFYMGALVSLTLLIALLADLFLLPILVQWWLPDRKRISS
jgi:predicted RND superfamily exporter protein